MPTGHGCAVLSSWAADVSVRTGCGSHGAKMQPGGEQACSPRREVSFALPSRQGNVPGHATNDFRHMQYIRRQPSSRPSRARRHATMARLLAFLASAGRGRSILSRLAVAAAALMLVAPRCAAQQFCAGSTKVVCGRCPNECPTCVPVDHNMKCPGASWGNTNSTFMNLSCAVPGLPPENFPNIPILSPVYSAPLECSGTVRYGLWPYDAENSTFSFETTFRDPKMPDQSVNSVFLRCVTLSLTIDSSGAKDLESTAEALTCKFDKATRDIHDYSGLVLYVCVGINVRLDPTCQKGRWVPAVMGACIGETVTGLVELTDVGSRLLIRVGGPGQLTGCQPKWRLRVERTMGSCVAVKPGYGNCCEKYPSNVLYCVNGYRDRSTACKCICPKGFVGVRCDRTAPHLSLSLVVFNRTRSAWWVSDPAHVGGGQTTAEFGLTSTLSDLLGVLPSRIELAFATEQRQLGSGAQPKSRRAGTLEARFGASFTEAVFDGDGFASVDLAALANSEPETGEYATADSRGDSLATSSDGAAQRRAMNASLCAGDVPIQGQGLAKVEVRLLYTFEHELPFARKQVEFAVSNGTLERGLAAKGIYLCILDFSTKNFNAFGFEMASRDPQQMSQGMSLQDILVIVFVVVGVAVALFYVWLQYLVARSRQYDAERHLNEYKPILRHQKHAVGWRLVNPQTKEPMHLPPHLNRQLEAWYICQWLQEGAPQLVFDLPNQGVWTADFSSMRAYETTAGQKFMCVQVKDGMTLILDRSASTEDHHYNHRSVTITAIPEGSDPRLLNQERTCTAYSALLRELRTDSPFVPPPPPGIQVTVGGRTGATYREMLPPGMAYEDTDLFRLEEQPPKKYRRRYQAWLTQSRVTTKYRLAHEVHYPVADPAPPTADANIFRLKEIQEKAELIALQKHAAVHEQNPLGRLDTSGITHFSGEDLASWQARNYNRWREVEREKEDFQKHVQNIQHNDQTENASLDDPRLPDMLLREEIFRPGSSTQILAKFGLPQQGGPGSHVMRQPSVASAESGGGSSAMRVGEARRRKLNKERDAEILDEVAV